MALQKEVVPILIGLFAISLPIASAIQCYQCDSNEDTSCPASRRFDPRGNALVDCGSFEAKVPGSFCVKIYQESTGWHSWIKITRRCASRSNVGIAWGCRYWFEDQGIYKEVCYCSDRNGCNNARRLSLSASLLTMVLLIPFLLLR